MLVRAGPLAFGLIGPDSGMSDSIQSPIPANFQPLLMYRRELRNAGIRYENSVMHRVVIPKMGDGVLVQACFPENFSVQKTGL